MGSPEQICAIFDVQGFTLEQNSKQTKVKNPSYLFVPKELAVFNNDFKAIFEIEVKLDEKTRIRNSKSIYLTQRWIHGIPLHTVLKSNKVIKENDFESFLLKLYNAVKTSHKIYVGVQNYQLEAILKKLSIPTYNLSDNEVYSEQCPGFARFSQITSSQEYCSLHALFITDGYTKDGIRHYWRCALRKCAYIWDWLQTEIKTNKLLNQDNTTLTDKHSNCSVFTNFVDDLKCEIIRLLELKTKNSFNEFNNKQLNNCATPSTFLSQESEEQY